VSNVANIDTRKRLQQLEQIFQPQLNKKIGSLSRGNKQKIALIAAFCANPELVILDEPTSGLDPIMQEKFLQLVREEQQRGSTVFMSSHNLNEVADVCSRIILLRSGKVIKDVAASELLQKSGKQVRVVTGDKQLRPPAGAENIKKQLDADKNRILEFNWKHSPADLQHWVANIHKLIDIEITEFDLETAFQDMYEEGKPL
jgi:ABC-2 type transport system ATP-binding protein